MVPALIRAVFLNLNLVCHAVLRDCHINERAAYRPLRNAYVLCLSAIGAPSFGICLPASSVPANMPTARKALEGHGTFSVSASQNPGYCHHCCFPHDGHLVLDRYVAKVGKAMRAVSENKDTAARGH
jgi:hypothetical protein